MTKNRIASTILRVVLGLTFMLHGWQKMQMGLGNVGGYFNSLGLPSWLAYVVGNLELFGGLLLIVGLLTRYISMAFSALMLGAIIFAKSSNGFFGTESLPGYEIDLVLLAITAFFAISGSVGFSLDALFKRDLNGGESRKSD
ncbi:hypothetical protein CIG75_10370 [Tumebacillus algifaecis]|uniref:Oxidoreductase n=1 Tax=Tumebacillus algifaecis TaxID=1214604 RepID=A0A223D1Z9_9BACL|nr:DoxX family protein [Tumebacillus algifaecis]ASS75356.1 hypothetical protein CIG75_10370 [Tumebacillus algifaecis]